MYEYDYDKFKDMSCNNFFKYLLSLTPNELALLGSGLGFLLSIDLDANKLGSLGNFFELIGQVMLTISSQKITLQPNSPSRVELKQEINYLRSEIERLKKLIS